MPDKRVAKPFKNTIGKLRQFVFRKVEGRDDFLEYRFLQECTCESVFHRVAHRSQTVEVGNRNEGSMRSVKDPALACAVRSLVFHEQHLEPCLFSGQQLSNALRSFNDPKMEWFGGYHEVIFKANFLPDLVDVFPGKAGHDTIHQRIAKDQMLFDPLQERFWKPPQLNVLNDHFAKLRTVPVNQFTRDYCDR